MSSAISSYMQASTPVYALSTQWETPSNKSALAHVRTHICHNHRCRKYRHLQEQASTEHAAHEESSSADEWRSTNLINEQ